MERLGAKRIAALTVLTLAAALCSPSYADTYPLPPKGQSLVGKMQWIHANQQDTLSDLARRFDLGYDEIVRANPDVDPWLPKPGAVVHLPMQHILPNAPRKGIVLNLAEKRLYYYPKPKPGKKPVVITYPTGIGRVAWNTPVGHTHVARKIRNPTWYPPASIRQEHAKAGDPLPAKVTPGPDDPLGHFALKLALPEYLIHGTNKPYGIGMRVSHGCIRLYPEDIANLFVRVPKGTPVDIVNQPYKAGWSDGHLYLQAYPDVIHENKTSGSAKHNDDNAGRNKKNQADVGNMTPMVHSLEAAAKKRPGTQIDWKKADAVARQATGIPTIVGTSSQLGNKKEK